jgi:BirA family biotin operon repressor/biotin-[acetyl-CoA-carboxylase] ligase
MASVIEPRDHALESRLAASLAGRPVHAFRTIGSTMEIAHQLAAEGAPDGTLVVAERQERGRGRLGRAWVSPSGGAYLSVIAWPARPPTEYPQLALVAGLAAAETLRDAACAYPSIRWPNDLFINDKKVGGILTETSSLSNTQNAGRRTPYVVIGVGINVATDAARLPEGSTSLAAEGAAPVSREEVIAGFCRRFDRWYDVWAGQGFGPIRRALRPWLGHFGQIVRIAAGSERFEGTAQDLDDHGRLVVRLDSGVQRAFDMGEVALMK